MSATPEQLKSTIESAQIDRAFRSAFVNLQGRVSKGVYPNVVALLADLAKFQKDIATDGQFEQFSADPMVSVFSQVVTPEAVTGLQALVTLIETIERNTTPTGEANGVFELNLPPLEA